MWPPYLFRRGTSDATWESSSNVCSCHKQTAGCLFFPTVRCLLCVTYVMLIHERCWFLGEHKNMLVKYGVGHAKVEKVLHRNAVLFPSQLAIFLNIDPQNNVQNAESFSWTVISCMSLTHRNVFCVITILK